MARQKYRQLPSLSESDCKRFWRKVDIKDSAKCWPWKAACQGGNRGLFCIGANVFKAPRIAYYLFTGIDLGRRDTCHTCDNPRCCNPAHIWAGTRKENNADRDRKGRQIAHLGIKHGTVILTEQQVRYILTSNETGRSLAKYYGVCESTVSYIRCGRNWKHIKT